VRFWEVQLALLRKQKEEAEHKALEERKKREAEETLRKQREKELHAEKQRSLYLSSARYVTPEVEDLLHAVSLSSTKLSALWGLLTNDIFDKTLSREELSSYLDEMKFYIDRINQLSKLLTKADIKFLSEEDNVDIKEYVKSYIKNFSSSIPIIIGEEYEGLIMKRIPILDLSVIIDNLISNSKKANAQEITIDFKANDRIIELYFSDNGDGVDLTQYTPNDIFKQGVTNRRGGSGIGLSTIKRLMIENLRGEIEFYANAVRYKQGATFKLIFR
jgi:signal transduction histidine kinase